MFVAPTINALALIISCVLCEVSFIIGIGFAISGLYNDDFENLRASLVLILISIVMGFFFASACVNESNCRIMNSALEVAAASSVSVEQTSQAAE